MFDNEGYLGFTFAGHHCSEYGLMVVSDGSRYHQNLSSSFSDTVTSVPGKNGGYYFGTQIQMRDFDINCVFDDMTTHTRNKIQNWLYPNKVGWLIFDEMPYKKYLVKISGIPNFSFLPFDKVKNTEKYIINHEILKGELNISFFSFNEFAIRNNDYELPNIYENQTIIQQVIDSGIIPDNYELYPVLVSNKTIDLVSGEEFSIYNAGNGISEADFYFTIQSRYVNNEQDPIIFYNEDNAQSYIIQDFSSEFDSPIISYYKIEILGTKKEIWATAYNSSGVAISSRINIGAYFNHYFPKIYHVKPTEIMLVTQSIIMKIQNLFSILFLILRKISLLLILKKILKVMNLKNLKITGQIILYVLNTILMI